MLIRKDDCNNYLIRTKKGPRLSQYKMCIGGWYGGGFSAKSDTAAIQIYVRIKEENQ